MRTDKVYAINGNKGSEQAESSTANLGAGRIDMRVLVELQLISLLLYQQGSFTDDIAKLRQDIADSIT